MGGVVGAMTAPPGSTNGTSLCLRRAFLISCGKWACNVSQKLNQLDLMHGTVSKWACNVSQTLNQLDLICGTVS